ncbi:MAG: hypothetical protein AB8I08_40955 [Sandaracinaceae bacterium]
MSGYRDDRETLLRRIESLEADLAAARSDDVSAAEDLAGLREQRNALRDELKRVRRERDRGERTRGELEEELGALRARLGEEPRTPDRLAVAGVVGVLLLTCMAAFGVPVVVVVIAAVAFTCGFVFYAMRRTSAPALPVEPPSITPKRRTLRARVEVDQRRKDARMAAKRRSRKQRRRRR